MSSEGVSSSQSNSGSEKKTVTVKSGAWKKEFQSGLTVREYREKLNLVGSVPDGAVAFSGTTQLRDEDIVDETMSLEFIKKTGEKG